MCQVIPFPQRRVALIHRVQEDERQRSDAAIVQTYRTMYLTVYGYDCGLPDGTILRVYNANEHLGDDAILIDLESRSPFA